MSVETQRRNLKANSITDDSLVDFISANVQVVYLLA